MAEDCKSNQIHGGNNKVVCAVLEAGVDRVKMISTGLEAT